jgi:protein SCO1/2
MRAGDKAAVGALRRNPVAGWGLAAVLTLAVLLWAMGAHAHEKKEHGTGTAALPQGEAVPADDPAAPPLPFPAKLGGPFTLTDQFGEARSDRDFRGRYMLIFFGYSNCESICPVGLRRMAEAIDILGETAREIDPILITVDPERDTPERLREAAPEIHARLVALTGSGEDLAAVRRAYQVEARFARKDWKGEAIFSHGSYLYLMGRDGEFLTLMPPILGPERMAEIIASYL